MKTNTLSISNTLALPLVLGAAAAVIVYAALTGKQLPLIGSPKAALIALLIVGMAMCTSGIGQVSASGKWTSPLAIVGDLLGAGILVVVASVFTGWKLPLIQGETQAVAVVGGMILVKYLIGTASFFLHLL